MNGVSRVSSVHLRGRSFLGWQKSESNETAVESYCSILLSTRYTRPLQAEASTSESGSIFRQTMKTVRRAGDRSGNGRTSSDPNFELL